MMLILKINKSKSKVAASLPLRIVWPYEHCFGVGNWSTGNLESEVIESFLEGFEVAASSLSRLVGDIRGLPKEDSEKVISGLLFAEVWMELPLRKLNDEGVTLVYMSIDCLDILNKSSLELYFHDIYGY